MLSYDLKTGYSCNNRCKHCVIEDSKDKLMNNGEKIDLTTEECFSQIEYAKTCGATNVVLTGGEVTIRKDFLDLIRKCQSSRLNVTVQTNGRMLRKKEILDKLSKDDNITFIIALHGSKANTHDSITQVVGSFNETCQGIKQLCNKGMLVVVKVVMSKVNMYELPDIVFLSNELGVKYICFAFPHGQGAARRNFDVIIPRYSEIRPLLEETIKCSEKCGIQIEFEDVPYCIIPKHMKLVGELKYLNKGALCTQVGEETYNWNEIRKSIKSNGEQCSCCDLNNLCEGVWSEYVEAFGDNEFRPIKLNDKYKEALSWYLRKNKVK